eukprot:gene17789-biopygen12840
MAALLRTECPLLFLLAAAVAAPAAAAHCPAPGEALLDGCALREEVPAPAAELPCRLPRTESGLLPRNPTTATATAATLASAGSQAAAGEPYS